MSTPARQVIPGSVEIPGADILRAQRASDADRDRVIGWLKMCHETGRIDAGVFATRMGLAAECATLDGLTALLADLPPLAPPRPGLLGRIRGLRCGALARRWLHAMLALAAVCWAIVPAVVIFTGSGYPVTYGTGAASWVQTEHPGLALMFVWLFVITGIAGLVGAVLWWASWEVGGD